MLSDSVEGTSGEREEEKSELSDIAEKFLNPPVSQDSKSTTSGPLKKRPKLAKKRPLLTPINLQKSLTDILLCVQETNELAKENKKMIKSLTTDVKLIKEQFAQFHGDKLSGNGLKCPNIKACVSDYSLIPLIFKQTL